jgi:D-alanyl-D-alanine carboxypeptidase/D-alanyl-D-alanine-endopeptidase (penicillin-binding protein 4)
MVDGGRRGGRRTGPRSPSPTLDAGARFLDVLKARGVTVAKPVRRGAAGDSADLAAVHSPTVAALVERMLSRSDNNIAEALLRRAAIERGLPRSFEGGVEAARQALTSVGVRVDNLTLRDGSGLSRENRLTTDVLAAVVRAAAADDRPQLRPLLTGLPVAGFSGTLAGRYRTPTSNDGAGRVRAKTGTLNNVTTLAGMVATRDGQLLVFAASADRVPSATVTSAARSLDVAVSTLARCGCG